eukprot:TRINITY_DN62443_c0_g3_i1.p1 TRINITY_DN62443_c0_g3~~TRINITY_DN62443_c0_g3_i1.p1  ORF type:complete len:781 (+),score=130.33 TRINITY_DN62443_c0_g3_i1:69-2345(+)
MSSSMASSKDEAPAELDEIDVPTAPQDTQSTPTPAPAPATPEPEPPAEKESTPTPEKPETPPPQQQQEERTPSPPPQPPQAEEPENKPEPVKVEPPPPSPPAPVVEDTKPEEPTPPAEETPAPAPTQPARRAREVWPPPPDFAQQEAEKEKERQRQAELEAQKKKEEEEAAAQAAAETTPEPRETETTTTTTTTTTTSQQEKENDDDSQGQASDEDEADSPKSSPRGGYQMGALEAAVKEHIPGHPGWAAAAIAEAVTNATDGSPLEFYIHHWYQSHVQSLKAIHEFQEDMADDETPAPEEDRIRLQKFADFLDKQRQLFARILSQWGAYGQEIQDDIETTLSDPKYAVPMVEEDSASTVDEENKSQQQTLKPPESPSMMARAETDTLSTVSGSGGGGSVGLSRRSSSSSAMSTLSGNSTARLSVVENQSTVSSPFLTTPRDGDKDGWERALKAAQASDSPVPLSARTENSEIAYTPQVTKAGPDRHRMKLFLEVLEEPKEKKERMKLVVGQEHRCKDCLNFFGSKKKVVGKSEIHARFCNYTGFMYCTKCHTKQKAPIPGRMVQHWDFTDYGVCKEAHTYLISIYNKPVLCLSALCPQLYDLVPALDVARRLRVQLGILFGVVKTCKKFDSSSFRMDLYYCEDTEMYSMRDLRRMHSVQKSLGVKNKQQYSELVRANYDKNEMLIQMKKMRTILLDHVMKGCRQGCFVRSRHKCQLCTNTEPLYSFDINNTIICPRCNRVYHKMCYKLQPCKFCFPS